MPALPSAACNLPRRALDAAYSIALQGLDALACINPIHARGLAKTLHIDHIQAMAVMPQHCRDANAVLDCCLCAADHVKLRRCTLIHIHAMAIHAIAVQRRHTPCQIAAAVQQIT
jgi:hypothetical protein